MWAKMFEDDMKRFYYPLAKIKCKKLRRDIFHIQPIEQSLKLYDAYLRISVVPKKTTFSGNYEKCLMISCGRRYNSKRAKDFLDSNSPIKEKILKSLGKELNLTPEQIIKSHKNGKLKGLLIDAVALQVKHLGIPVTLFTKRSGYEIFEYVKFNDIEEVFQFTLGSILSLGRAIKEFGSEEQLLLYKLKIKNLLEKFMDRGYYG